MKKIQHLVLVCLLSFAGFNSHSVYAHCEIPCGIYEDSLRIAIIKEHVTTIEKSMKKIAEISSQESPDYNQLVRWVNNKEEHANKIQEIVSQYFLHQRVKIIDPSKKDAYKRYQNQLIALHQIAFYAMKSKQSIDLNMVSKLTASISSFEHLYFNNDHHGHKH